MYKKVLSILLTLTALMTMGGKFAFAAGVKVTLDKPGYLPNEDIKISVSGITDEMVKAGAFAGLYESGAAYNKSLMQTTLKAGSSTVAMKAPATAGTYEVRVYQRGAPCLKKITFTVGTSVPAKTQAPTQAPTPEPTQPPSRTLSAAEKELVGEYCYSSSVGFYETYAHQGYYQGIWTDFTQLSGGSNLVVFYFFNTDGTYMMMQGAGGNLAYTGIFNENGNWTVTATNTISLTNRLQSFTSDNGRNPSYQDKVMDDSNLYYVKSTFNGKQGYYFDSYSTPDKIQEIYVGSRYSFYEKVE